MGGLFYALPLRCLRALLLHLAAFDHAHDVALLHDQELFAVDLHLGAGPFAEQDDVAGLHFQRGALAGLLIDRAGTDRDDFALLGLLLHGVGDDDAAGSLGVFLDAANDHAV